MTLRKDPVAIESSGKTNAREDISRRLIILDVSQLEVSGKERMLHSHAFELYSGKVRVYITPKY